MWIKIKRTSGEVIVGDCIGVVTAQLNDGKCAIFTCATEDGEVNTHIIPKDDIVCVEELEIAKSNFPTLQESIKNKLSKSFGGFFRPARRWIVTREGHDSYKVYVDDIDDLDKDDIDDEIAFLATQVISNRKENGKASRMSVSFWSDNGSIIHDICLTCEEHIKVEHALITFKSEYRRTKEELDKLSDLINKKYVDNNLKTDEGT